MGVDLDVERTFLLLGPNEKSVDRYHGNTSGILWAFLFGVPPPKK